MLHVSYFSLRFSARLEIRLTANEWRTALCFVNFSKTFVPFQHQLTFQCRKQLDSNRIWRQARFASGLLERAWCIEVHAQVEFQIVPRETLASHWRADSSTWIVAWCRHKRKENHQYVVCCENKFSRNILAFVRNKNGSNFSSFHHVKSRVAGQFRKESGVFGWSRNPKNTRSRSRIFLSDSYSGIPTESLVTSHS